MITTNNDTFEISDIDFFAITDTSKLPQPTLAPIEKAHYKLCNKDFIVNEVMALEFTGDGEHLWLHMQKSGMNTAYVAKLLADWADIPLRDVGYSGLKDRHALTSQWFSLRLPKKQLPPTDFAPSDLSDNESLEILAKHWHNKKLNRGAHRANQFVITLRDIEYANDLLIVDKQALVEQHLEHISQHGVPNYFGPQRFGHNGNNIKEALRLFAQPIQSNRSTKSNKRKRAPRESHTMMLSAARSLIFNQILAARVRDDSWSTGLAGEVFNLNGSGSIFTSEQLDDELRARLNSGDIHPTAVMWGVSNDKVTSLAAKIETDVVQKSGLLTALATGLEQHDIKAQRRALRLPVEALSWNWMNNKTLILHFTLPTGSFATSVLASLVQQLQLLKN